MKLRSLNCLFGHAVRHIEKDEEKNPNEMNNDSSSETWPFLMRYI